MTATTTRRGAALAAVLALCAPLGAAPAKDGLTLSLKEKVIKNLSSSGLVLAFHIAVDNGSAKPRDLVRYRYRVRIDQREYINTTVTLPEPLAVPAGGKTLIALPVKISYDLLKAALGPVEDKALCDIVGDMFFRNDRNREEKVAFAYSGEFPVFQDPEIDLLPLKVNDLTVGGADVVFRPRFRNGNRYELIVDRIDFTLAFSGREVLAGPIEGDKSLPRTGEKTFALPFILDFFEAGEDVRAGFDKDEFPCRFAGRIEIASVWGRLVILFDKTQNIRLERVSR
ncbi:MAG: LEA type 2 family protein [Candidatus Aminicenantes bacterium]|nr:LEA type 2 family protein [Candidatus Aminicenantes bacterium]NLH75910.1 LEA type 2 family protein [Acidobacteriota bacterium]